MCAATIQNQSPFCWTLVWTHYHIFGCFNSQLGNFGCLKYMICITLEPTLTGPSAQGRYALNRQFNMVYESSSTLHLLG